MKNVVGRILAFIMVIATVGGIAAMFINNLAYYNMKKEVDKNNQEIDNNKLEETKDLLVDFSVVFPDGDKKENSLKSEFKSLKELLEKGMENLDIEYKEENGSTISSINSIENEGEEKWNIYVNNSLLQAPLNSIKVNDGDEIKIIWGKK